MIAVTLPQLSLAMEEGKLIRWLVANGAQVSAGQPILEIETDKAITEVEAPAAGIVRFLVAEDAVVPVETVLAEIEAQEGETSPAKSDTAPSTLAPATVAEEPAAIASAAREPEPASTLRLRASPAARRVAKELGVDLARAHGTGPEGRITVRDLEGMAALKPSLRESVVAELEASWRSIPHIHIAGELDGSGLAKAKEAAAATITITDLLVVATARSARIVPELNGTRGKISERVHVALAVATPNGVVSPVIRNADELSLDEIARHRARIVTAARAGAPDRHDFGGGTITLTNLGAFPVDYFGPIVSGPQIATIATGRLTEKPIVANDVIGIGHRLWVNVAIDHRAADGLSGARFLAAFEQCLNELLT